VAGWVGSAVRGSAIIPPKKWQAIPDFHTLLTIGRQHGVVEIRGVPAISISHGFRSFILWATSNARGGSLGCIMSGREFETDLLSAFALTIGSALSIAIPLAMLTIWICS
jgi:hypothetical protein